MKFKLTETLKIATPYMLRNDGELFECGSMHPYIKYIYNSDSKKELIQMLEVSYKQDFLIWFYEHTNNDNTKKYIETIIKSSIIQKIASIQSSFVKCFSINDDTNYTEDEIELLECYELLNEMCNQEFCKIRTSSLKFGGTSQDVFIRIGSVGFNWFNLIWEFIYSNKNFVTSVTISSDSQSDGKPITYYSHNGNKIYMMPTDEFINLSGNPIIEKLYSFSINNAAHTRLEEGEDVASAYGDIHPRYILGFLKELRENHLCNI